MKTMIVCSLVFFLAFAFPAFSQSTAGQSSSPAAQQSVHKNKKKNKPGKEMAHGGADIGKGAAKGSADLGKGVASGVGNLATGNVGGAATSVGEGGAGFGKHVAVGTGKGAAKIGKGMGGEFRKLHRKSKKEEKK